MSTNMKLAVATFAMIFLALATQRCAHAWDCSVWSQSSNPSEECYKAPGATQNATQGQGQQQGQGQSQTATGGAGGVATNAGNSQSTSFSSPRQAVDGYSSGTNNTSACALEQHAGVGSILGGFSIGRGKRDKDCARQVLATQLWDRGQIEAGNKVYCDITEVKQALGGDCLKLMNERAPAPDAVTQQQLQEVERRITTHMVSK